MAIDTRTKRQSVQGYTTDAMIIAPVADGTIDAFDRAHITGIYAGITVAIGSEAPIGQVGVVDVPPPTCIIDVYDGSGVNRQGDGPLMTVFSASVKRTLDGAGTFDFTVSAADPRALELIQNERQVRIIVGHDGTMREIGRGRIRDIGYGSQESGDTLKVSGPDTLADLARRTPRLRRKYDNVALGDIVADLVGLVPGWSAITDSGLGSYSARFDGGNVLKALVKLVEQKALHFREGVSPQTVEVGAFGTASVVQALGAGAITREMHHNDDIILVTQLEQVKSTSGVINWLIPLGAGDTGSELTLASANNITSYPVESITESDGSLTYYIRNQPSIAAYGQIEQVIKLDNITPVDDSAAAQVYAANALYDAAVAYLDRNCVRQDVYKFSARKPRTTIRPGDKLRLAYHGWVIRDGAPLVTVDIDDWFWVLSVTEKWQMDGLSLDLEIATVDQHVQDIAWKLNAASEGVEALQFTVTTPN